MKNVLPLSARPDIYGFLTDRFSTGGNAITAVRQSVSVRLSVRPFPLLTYQPSDI